MKILASFLLSIFCFLLSAAGQSFLDVGWMARFHPPAVPPPEGEITLDGTSTNVVADSAEATVTWSHTISNTLAGGYVVVGWGGWRGSSLQQPSGISFDGTAMTSLGTSTHGALTSLWGLKIGNKAAGTYNIIVTNNLSAYQLSLNCSVWTGVNQTTPIGTPATASGTSTTPSVNVSSATGEVVVDVMGSYADTAAVGASQTILVAGVGAGENEDLYQSYEAGAATVTMSWTITSQEWGIIAVPLKP